MVSGEDIFTYVIIGTAFNHQSSTLLDHNRQTQRHI